MAGLGTIVNVAAIIVGGLCALWFGRLLRESVQDALGKVCGVCVLVIGMGGALAQMLRPQGGALVSGGGLLLIAALALGTLLGELIGIEADFERLGAWLKAKTGSGDDRRFIEGFVTASLTVCIGAMAIVGAIQDGLLGDHSVLFTKAILDFIIILVMTCHLGKGCIFSALPVAVLQGGVTLLAGLLRPVMTAQALSNLSLVGSVLIFCVGINLVWGKKLRVANMLPAVVLAVAFAFLPVF